jgi:flagellar basal-body rod protein FlgF
MMFVEHLVKSRGGHRIGGDKLAFVRDIATAKDLSEGAFQKTGNPLDLSISGDGFFVLGTPGGERYTRSGNFQMDSTGQLVTRNGDPLLSDSGEPFFMSPADTRIIVAPDGTLSTENGVLGKMAVVNFANKQAMRVVAGGMYSTEQAATPVEQPTIIQGMLEGSNVQPIAEMTRMIQVARSYESTKSFVGREDDRMKEMIKEFARPA